MKKISLIIIIVAIMVIGTVNVQAYLENYPKLNIGCKCFVGHKCYQGRDYDFNSVECIEEFCGPCDNTCATWNPVTQTCWDCGECGSVDKDDDGYGIGPGCIDEDCDDNDARVNPGRKEICNKEDDNCDDQVDEGLERYTLDAAEEECCPEGPELCLLDADGQQCAASGYFDSDYLCVDGNWASRTSYLATPLLKFAQEREEKNLSIFCGSYEEVLNNYEYATTAELGTVEATFFEPNGYCGVLPCADNMCVLKLQDGLVLVGVSMNSLDVSHLSDFLEYTGSCSNALANDGNFHACAPKTLALNTKYNLIIYSKQEFDINENMDLWKEFVYFIRGSVEEVYTHFGNPQQLMKVIKPNRLYFLYQESKNIFGFIEPGIMRGGSSKEILGIRYYNFLTDICEEVNYVVPGSCNAVDNKHIIQGEGADENEKLFDLWADITAKPRIEGEVEPCVGEGATYSAGDVKGCCFGLKPVTGASGFICTKCGDSVCGIGETASNCQDCVAAEGEGCVEEGLTYPVVSGQKCCEGLRVSALVEPDETTGVCPVWDGQSFICTDCGDGNCDAPLENKCNCGDCQELCAGPGVAVSAGQTCCVDLAPISNSQLVGGACEAETGQICNNCGDLTCDRDHGENECNCEDDCGAPPAQTCADTDAGQEYDVQGTVTLGADTNTDYCDTTGDLVEYYCQGNQIRNETYTCPTACAAGACNP